MNGMLLPEVLRELPVPWCLSDPVQRRDALERLPATPDQRAVALSALERGLAYTVQLGPYAEDDDMNSYPALNDHFDEAWVFFGRDLTARMPTFRDADRATVVAWLSSIDTELLFGERWAEPPDAVVDDLSRLWANGKAIGLSASAVRWLQAAFRDGDPSEDPALVRDRERFVALLKSAIPRLPWREAMQPIGVIWSLGHDRELEYFAALADDPALHPKTRAEAAHYREICEDERAAREAQEGGIE